MSLASIFIFFLGLLPFFLFFYRSSSIYFWGRLSSWVKIRLHTENQLPRLPGSALKVPVGRVGGVSSYPLLSQAPTHVEVELGCDNWESAEMCIIYRTWWGLSYLWKCLSNLERTNLDQRRVKLCEHFTKKIIKYPKHTYWFCNNDQLPPRIKNEDQKWSYKKFK